MVESYFQGRPGFPLPGENEPLHALVTGPSQDDVKNAVKVVCILFLVLFLPYNLFTEVFFISFCIDL